MLFLLIVENDSYKYYNIYIIYMDKFWIYNIDIIYSDYLNLFPNINNDVINNLNILSRLYFYLILLLLVLKKKLLYIIILLIGLLLIVFYYFIIVYIRDNNKCHIPNKDNPYMNYMGTISKIDSCYINDKKINELVSEYTNDSIFNYINDRYYKNKFDRYFYTKPHNIYMLNYTSQN